MAYVATMAAGLVAALIVLKRWLPRPHAGGKAAVGLRQVLSFSIIMCVTGVGLFVLSSADVLILGRYIPSRELGVCVAALRASGFVIFPLSAINALFAPVISELFTRGDMEGLRRTYLTTTRWATGTALALFGVLVVAPRLVLSVFGSEFREGVVVLVILGLGQLVNSSTGSCGWVAATAFVGLFPTLALRWYR